MSTAPTSENPPGPRRVKKRWLIPLGLLALVAFLLLFAYVRGTWADSVPKDPASSAEGIITQIYQTPENRKQVRAAVVLDHSPGAVWAVVADYPNHDKIFRHVKTIQSSRESDGSCHLTGVAQSSIWGDWPYEAHVFHEESPEQGRFLARWDEPSGPITVNRGSWAVQPAGEGKTLLVYTLEIEVGRYPTWIIRNLILDRIDKVVADVEKAVKQRGPRSN